ncbi:MAG: putative lipid II flippase FtsW [Patescibacteria group bacterium]|jgi:cell division protein FtsW
MLKKKITKLKRLFARSRFLRFRMNFSGLVREKANYHQPDYLIIGVVFFIVCFGLIMLSSASSAISFAKSGSTYSIFNNQLYGIIFGIFAFLVLSRFDYHRFRDVAILLLGGSLILLILVFIPSFSAGWGHAKSWISVFGFSVQPSELVKITFLLYLAAWVEKRGRDLFDLHQGTMPFIILLGFISFLMLMQPDTGTLLILLSISLVVYFIGGGNIKHIAVMGLVGFVMLFLLVKVAPYQADRFRCYFDPGYSPEDTCYQVSQSLIAAGSGGILGRGFGNSRQKFRYLPEVQGDAIFPIIAEEMGFIVSSILVLLYALLFYRGYLVSRSASDKYGSLLAIGIVTWFCVQAFINISGMINFLPMTGVPLPFISYGGSAMVAALAAAGILVNISKQTR